MIEWISREEDLKKSISQLSINSEEIFSAPGKKISSSPNPSSASGSGSSSRLFCFPEVIQRLLRVRGLDQTEKLEGFTSFQLSSLKDPFTMNGMEKAVLRLIQAYKTEEPLCLYGDFDLDGTSGLCLLNDGLQQLGFKNISWYQPKRLTEGYGFHEKVVEDLYKKNIKLIVTVDVGITAVASCEKAFELGVDVILTDHHQEGPELPRAFTIVNPNQKACSSSLNYLSGTGVAFYLLRALKKRMWEEKLIQEKDLDLKSLLDCFTIATITDMVPLIEDNRVLIKHGLHQLRNSKRPGLRALLGELGLAGRPLNGQDVGIRFAPKLNALSRMELDVLPIDIFMVKEEALAQHYVKQAIHLNKTRLSLQQSAEIEAIEKLKDWPFKNFVFVSSKNFHRGLIGIVATKVSQFFGVPTFVGSQTEAGGVVGSARLPNNFVTIEEPHGSTEGAIGSPILKALESSKEFLSRYGGHPAAAGFEYSLKDEEKIIEKIQDYFKNFLSPNGPAHFYYDLNITLDDINENLLKGLDDLGPYGTSFQVPLFCLFGVKVKKLSSLKGGHKKLQLDTSSKLEALFFSPPQNIDWDSLIKQKLDLIVELQWNYFQGKQGIQLLIKELRISENDKEQSRQ